MSSLPNFHIIQAEISDFLRDPQRRLYPYETHIF